MKGAFIHIMALTWDSFVLAVPENRSPIAPVNEIPEIGRRDLIGGLIREYHAVAS